MNLTDIPEDVHSLIFRYVYDFIIRDLNCLFKQKETYKDVIKEVKFYYTLFGCYPKNNKASVKCLHCLKYVFPYTFFLD